MEREANCEIDFVNCATGEVSTEAFIDPFLYKLRDGLTVAFSDRLVAIPKFGASGVLVRYDGVQWTLGTSFGGRPITSALVAVSDLSVPPPKR